MNYQLAKQLKDAGFPQGVKEDHRPELVKKLIENDVFLPSLEDLVDACGPSDNYTVTLNMWGDFTTAIKGKHLESGDTPIEAVAKLWLKLNQKV